MPGSGKTGEVKVSLGIVEGRGYGCHSGVIFLVDFGFGLELGTVVYIKC